MLCLELKKVKLMRLTIDIDEETLDTVLALTSERKKSTAIAKAVDEFVRRRRAREFGQLIRESAFDYGGDPIETEDEDPLNPVPPLNP